MLSPTSKPDGRSTRLSRTRVIPAKAGIQRCEGSAARLSQTHVIPAKAGIQRCEGRATQVMSVQGSGERPLSGRRLPATSGGGGYSTSEGYN